MRSLVSAVLVSTMFAATAMAEPRSFSLNDPSGQFLVEVLFPDVPQDLQQLAPALITLRDKTTLAVLQQLNTPAAGVPLDRAKWQLMVDTDLLIKKIRVALTQTGKVAITNTIQP